MLVVLLTRSAADCIITLGLDRVDQPPSAPCVLIGTRYALALARLLRNLVS